MVAAVSLFSFFFFSPSLDYEVYYVIIVAESFWLPTVNQLRLTVIVLWCPTVAWLALNSLALGEELGWGRRRLCCHFIVYGGCGLDHNPCKGLPAYCNRKRLVHLESQKCTQPWATMLLVSLLVTSPFFCLNASLVLGAASIVRPGGISISRGGFTSSLKFGSLYHSYFHPFVYLLLVYRRLHAVLAKQWHPLLNSYM